MTERLHFNFSDGKQAGGGGMDAPIWVWRQVHSLGWVGTG